MEFIADFNPLTGERCVIKTEGGKLHITNEQDVTSILDSATDLRNRTSYSQTGIKNDHWHYARIPNGVALEMKAKHGVDMFAPKPDWKAILKCINTHYPALKTTDKIHA
jgi:hypothetical protein